MLISPHAVHLLGSQIATKDKNTDPLEDRTFVSFYGASPEIIAESWDRIREQIPKGKPKHMMWACMFMKLYLPEDAMCVIVGTSKPTFKKWVWQVVEALALDSANLIVWAKRKRNLPADATCCVSIDGTDFKTEEPFPFSKQWKSPKYSGSALKYEVAISIFSGDIVWVNGPHRGSKHDLTIFRQQPIHMLEKGEMVEADLGYIGEANWIRSKDDYCTKAERKEKDRVRARGEACNRRFKCWGILKQEFRHDDKKHGLVFRAIAGLTQLNIDNGGCLFGCEPTAKQKERYSIDDLEL